MCDDHEGDDDGIQLDLGPVISLVKRDEIILSKDAELTAELVEALSSLGYDVESMFVPPDQTTHEFMGLCEECGRVVWNTMEYTRDPESGVVWCRECFEKETEEASDPT